MDFYRIREREKNGVIEIAPDFIVKRSQDLMVRAKSFYAVWNDNAGLWSTDEYEVARLIDHELDLRAQELGARGYHNVRVSYMQDFGSGSWSEFRRYLSLLTDNFKQLDEQLTFANTEVKKNDYVSKQLPYKLQDGDRSAWDELLGVLYEPSEIDKIEWAIGSVISGDAKRIQKFFVFYGAPGSGKSTILNVIELLFTGYTTAFEAKSLVGGNNSFATEVFARNPLVGIQQDGDLSRIEDNTVLNSIVAHDIMTINEKYKPAYSSRINAMLFLGTNKPVRITDAKSGIIRRLVDISPSNRKLPFHKYQVLINRISFELGAIAQKCLDRYQHMGPSYYDTYVPTKMLFQTDLFFNYVSDNFEVFKYQEYVTLRQAYELYKEYCYESNITKLMPKYRFRDELMEYFKEYHMQKRIGDEKLNRVFVGFKAEKILSRKRDEEPAPLRLVLDQTESIFDKEFYDAPAQYANESGTPGKRWVDVDTTLSDIDTANVHYVRLPPDHVVIDFDLRDENGEKSPERNLVAAAQWPPTYAEFSKSGGGVHLHYTYTGDHSVLAPQYSDGIEIKAFTGGASLRRKLSLCNSVPIAELNSGLPIKERKSVFNEKYVATEKGIRTLIIRNLHKEIHPGTKPSIDFIYKILDDAYSSGLDYDVSDLRPRVMAFAGRSTNQAAYCLSQVAKMKFSGKEDLTETEAEFQKIVEPLRLVFFDVEVFPNLFVISWKFEGSPTAVSLVNPTPQEVEGVLKLNLVGFNNRDYDNHILYAAMMGYNNEQLFKLSQRIIANSPNSKFREAYNLSYVDVYDYLNSQNKMSLKKWEIKLGIHHMELGLPWDKPVPEDLWPKVVEYCENDVFATEKIHEANQGDFIARKILAELSGLSVNAKTQTHTAKIIFGEDKNPQTRFVYTDLSAMFPGYSYEFGKSSYRGEDPGEGGYVYAEPGYYENVALLDVESMHPTSLINMGMFGPYTDRFKDLLTARLAIKHGDIETASTVLDGLLVPFLQDESNLPALSYGLKICANIVYGLTSAKYDNPFRDPRNVDNIVAKRGALFMIDLKLAVQEKGFTVIHIKTDSIKIANATQEIIDFVMEFGKQYGYKFAHEATYTKLCLINKAVYIAKNTETNTWDAVGAQFAHPFVYKSLFSHEPIEFDDLCETRAAKSALYLDFNEDSGDPHDYYFIGKVGRFTPINEGAGGGILLREKDGRYYAAAGSSGYHWMESEMVKQLNKEADIDLSYFDALAEAAIENIEKYVNIIDFTA